MKRDKHYFVSDLHLGLDLEKSSKEREALFVQWLQEISDDAHSLYLVGDVFDYWHEYKDVVPKGYIRLLGALAQLIDRGVNIHFFKGNHDLWTYGYLEKEIGLTVHDTSITTQIDGRTFFITHGDELLRYDRKYQRTRSLLRHPLAQKIFAILHPRLGIGLMRYYSGRSRDNQAMDQAELDRITTQLIDHLATSELIESIDYLICGHIHDPKLVALSDQATYCNLGDWKSKFSYAVWENGELSLRYYKS